MGLSSRMIRSGFCFVFFLSDPLGYFIKSRPQEQEGAGRGTETLEALAALIQGLTEGTGC